jgi:hypothetical protein
MHTPTVKEAVVLAKLYLGSTADGEESCRGLP